MTLRPRPARTLGYLALILTAAWTAGAGMGRAAVNAPAFDPAALARLSPLERAERLLPALEDAEAHGTLRSATSPWRRTTDGSDPMPLVRRVAAGVDSMLRLEPREARTNLICARFGRVMYELLGAPTDSTGTPRFSDPAFTTYIRALDRARVAEPANAELYYWKARLCSTVVPHQDEGRIQMEAIGPLEAVTWARRAVELAPTNDVYRATLALCLFSIGKLDEAAEAMRGAKRADHPLARLIEDWKAIPTPPRAERFDTEPANQREVLAARGFEYPTARVRCYSISADAAAVEKFYRAAFPAFKLIGEAPPAAGVTRFTCFLRWQDGALAPAAPTEQLGLDSAGSGLLVRVTEFRGEDALKQAHVYDPIGDTLCWIYLLDLRAAGER